MSADGVAEETRRKASTEWFHGLANHARGEIAHRCSSESVARLQEHVALCLTGQQVPEQLTPEQFAEVVHDLRDNELEWERAWLNAAVMADDLLLAGQAEEAVHALSAFARTCPWIAWTLVCCQE